MNITNVFSYIQEKIKSLSIRLVYSVLLMVYAFQSDRTPSWARKIILGALAYLLSPIDSIPDLTPVIGFTDDLGVITFGLVTVACYINTDIRNKAKEKLYAWFKVVDDEELNAVDKLL